MPVLPPDFADLEPFADWALESEAERYAKRLSSTMDQFQLFYDTAFPRFEDAIGYLDQFDLGALTEEAKHLFAQELAVEVDELRSPLGVPGEHDAGLLGYLRSVGRNN